jgi:D-alanyl-D-alanine carboxypeptidase/D-alanyl-D-alanine-endopeptidase (penicillin-binding protein 4)
MATLVAVLGLSLASGRLVRASQPQTGGDATAARLALIARLDAVLDDPHLDGVQVAVTVRSATTGEVVYDRFGNQRMVPASNQKLITSAAALADLGQDYRFRTSVLAGEAPRDGVVAGDVYLRGEGDPTLTPARLDDLAAAVAARGIREVRGRVNADDGYFDAVRLGTDWSWQDETFAYAAPIAALSLAPDADYNTGSVQVDILPGPTVGAPAQVGLTPPTRAVQLDNHVLTVAAGGRRALTGAREHGTNRIVVGGTMPLDGRPAHPLESVDDPAIYAADVFATALANHGVRVSDTLPRRAATPASAVEVAASLSQPLGELLVPLLKLSNNPMAEMLVKTMGARDSGVGTWPAGLQVALRFLATAGVDPARVHLVDGSGLSTSNLISTDDLSALLVAAQHEPWFTTWYAALPVAGAPDRLVGGTLADRMVDTPAAGNVHAKTGTLAVASALSGYVRSTGGESLVFSMLDSGFVDGPPREGEDALAVALASTTECLVVCDEGAPAAASKRRTRRHVRRNPPAARGLHSGS